MGRKDLDAFIRTCESILQKPNMCAYSRELAGEKLIVARGEIATRERAKEAKSK